MNTEKSKNEREGKHLLSWADGSALRVALLLLLCGVALACRFGLVSELISIRILAVWQPWILLGIIIFNLMLMKASLAKSGGNETLSLIKLSKKHAIGLSIIFSVLGFCLWMYPQGYRVLLDELVINNTSLALYHDHIIVQPQGMLKVDGESPLLLGVNVDKRPPLLALLTSFLHWTTGYRQSNIFTVNLLLSAGVLLMTYMLGAVNKDRLRGILGVLLWATLPIWTLQVGSGALAMLNLFLIFAVTIQAMRYWKSPDSEQLNFLVWLGLLLTFARYESALMLLPIACLFLANCWRKRHFELPWATVFSPLPLTLSMLGNRYVMSNEVFFQLDNGEKFMSFSYLGSNLISNLKWLWSNPLQGLGSPLIASLGIIFLIQWGVRMIAKFRSRVKLSPFDVALAFLIFGVGIQLLVQLNYFWSQWNDPAATRLSIPFHLILVVAVIGAANSRFTNRKFWFSMTAVVILYFVALVLPFSKQRNPFPQLPNNQRIELTQAILSHYNDPNTLFIGPEVNLALALNRSAISFGLINRTPKLLSSLLQQKLFDQIIIYRRQRWDPEAQAWFDDERAVMPMELPAKEIAVLQMGEFDRAWFGLFKTSDQDP